MITALWDTETDGLLEEATVMHCIGAEVDGQWYSSNDQPGWTDLGKRDVTLPGGGILKDVIHCTNEKLLRVIEKADLRVAMNGQDFDDRVTRRLYPFWKPIGRCLDTLLISRLVFPIISQQAPNTHKVEPKLRTRHSLEAWGQRLGAPKDDYKERKKQRLKDAHPDWDTKQLDKAVWSTWDPEMQTYMLQDVVTLKKQLAYLMSQKPAQAAVDREHRFADIIRRQESWGFTFDHAKAVTLDAKLGDLIQDLEAKLIHRFGSWWSPGKVTTVKATRREKLPQFPDVTTRRFGVNGKELKPHVGPPTCLWEAGAKYTPVEYIEFQPTSRDHVRLMLEKMYGWKPSKFTDKGTPQVDGDVLRALPWPEAVQMADFFDAMKIRGYVSGGNKSWLSLAKKEPDGCFRMHGRMNTVGTYTFRGSHADPNMGQIPSRGEYGHECRSLFMARPGFDLVGFDGSGMQLRLLAHHLARWDGGVYADVYRQPNPDPHSFMRDVIGTDLMGEGSAGRAKAKTLNYALCFGGGEKKLGSIIEPLAKDSRKVELGRLVKERMGNAFGDSFDQLKAALKAQVEDRRYIVGLDLRKAPCGKPHAALATLLQMGEAIVMRESLILLDDRLQAEGLRPGVGLDGVPRPELADYEFTANVHDEAQCDVRHMAVETYTKAALWCVQEAGNRLGLKCPLSSDVKVGADWSATH